MKNPLKNDKKCCPKDEICHPKPRKSLKVKFICISDKNFAHNEEENVELQIAYQAIQGGIAEQENKVD